MSKWVAEYAMSGLFDVLQYRRKLLEKDWNFYQKSYAQWLQNNPKFGNLTHFDYKFLLGEIVKDVRKMIGNCRWEGRKLDSCEDLFIKAGYIFCFIVFTFIAMRKFVQCTKESEQGPE